MVPTMFMLIVTIIGGLVIYKTAKKYWIEADVDEKIEEYKNAETVADKIDEKQERRGMESQSKIIKFLTKKKLKK